MSYYSDIIRKTCLCRRFELTAAELHRSKKITIPMYLSVGEEHIAAALSCALPGWPVFAQHRCHSYFLSFGGDPEALLKELLGREDGQNHGRGGSASVSMPGMFGHSGLLGDQIPIGVGYAHASGKNTLVVGGDAAFEEDYALAALGYAASKNVPVLFVCEDNDLSILTKKAVRRSWGLVEVARGFGLCASYVEDRPEEIYRAAANSRLPALLNIKTCRHLWHAGSGQDGQPQWDRYAEMKTNCSAMADMEREAEETCRQLLTRLGI